MEHWKAMVLTNVYGAALTIRATREAVAGNLRRSWDDMVKLELELCEMMFSHPDAHEGPAAFSEKREPRFGKTS